MSCAGIQRGLDIAACFSVCIPLPFSFSSRRSLMCRFALYAKSSVRDYHRAAETIPAMQKQMYNQLQLTV